MWRCFTGNGIYVKTDTGEHSACLPFTYLEIKTTFMYRHTKLQKQKTKANTTITTTPSEPVLCSR